MKRAWTAEAARNNARWCDAVCFASDKGGRFLEHIWVNADPVPRFYPNAVTLTRGEADIAEQREIVRILLKSNLPGRWAVKDSFCTLDITRLGFDVLLEANWIRKRHPEPGQPRAGLVWERGNLEGSDLPASLASDANFAKFVGTRGGSVVAGGTFYRTETIVGLSNVVAESGDAVAVWHDLAGIAAREFPGLPLVGYESGNELDAALTAGFEVGEALRVWVRSRE